MIKLELEGSYYEIGLQISEKCRNHASSYYTEQCTRERLDFSCKCVRFVEENFPELLEELQGIVDGGGFEYRQLVSSELAAGLKSSCTLLAFSGRCTESGLPLFARSMDWFQQALKFSAVYVTKPAGRLASLGISETFLGRLGGINEAGLAIGESSTCWENLRPGIINGVAVRRVLDTCRTAGEAASWLQKIPYIMGNNYLIADKQGDVVLVEAHPSKTVVTEIRRDFVAVANHYFSPIFDDVTPVKPKHSTDRIAYLDSWFKGRADPVSLDAVKMLQRTHDVELCPHVQEMFEGELRDLTTCWAWIATLGEGKMNLCEGSPCRNEYKEHSLTRV